MVKNDVKLPDEYDSIHHDLEPFWGVSPEDLQKIRDEWYEKEYRYTVLFGKENGQPLQILSNRMSEQKLDIHTESILERLRFLDPVDDLLPDFKAIITPSDSTSAPASWEHKAMLLEAAEDDGLLWRDVEPFGGVRWTRNVLKDWTWDGD